ncbi:Hypothetical_protein [Hexamita inflata]|uniref:Hypothetical_protein n=1 Tax=Hexamita inflata TaxID=28002 RepID=A0AA86PQ70_9EUKA|nr:Hypothetical protein HINF_LOCUS27100 [Hexamita inflata]
MKFNQIKTYVDEIICPGQRQDIHEMAKIFKRAFNILLQVTQENAFISNSFQPKFQFYNLETDLQQHFSALKLSQFAKQDPFKVLEQTAQFIDQYLYKENLKLPIDQRALLFSFKFFLDETDYLELTDQNGLNMIKIREHSKDFKELQNALKIYENVVTIKITDQKERSQLFQQLQQVFNNNSINNDQTLLSVLRQQQKSQILKINFKQANKQQDDYFDEDFLEQLNIILTENNNQQVDNATAFFKAIIANNQNNETFQDSVQRVLTVMYDCLQVRGNSIYDVYPQFNKYKKQFGIEDVDLKKIEDKQINYKANNMQNLQQEMKIKIKYEPRNPIQFLIDFFNYIKQCKADLSDSISYCANCINWVRIQSLPQVVDVLKKESVKLQITNEYLVFKYDEPVTDTVVLTQFQKLLSNAFSQEVGDYKAFVTGFVDLRNNIMDYNKEVIKFLQDKVHKEKKTAVINSAADFIQYFNSKVNKNQQVNYHPHQLDLKKHNEIRFPFHQQLVGLLNDNLITLEGESAFGYIDKIM